MPFLYILRDNLFAMILLLVVSGIGVTFILCAIPNVLTEFLPQENMGEAMGVVGVVGSIFSSVGISVFAVVLSSSVVPGTQLPQVSAYGITVALTAAGMVLAMASAFLLPRRSQRGATVAEPESVLAQE
jgi:MFS family permease